MTKFGKTKMRNQWLVFGDLKQWWIMCSLGDFITNKNMDPNGVHKMPLVHKDNAAQIIDWEPQKVQVKTNDVDIYFWIPNIKKWVCKNRLVML